jgi:hypothetical protein
VPSSPRIDNKVKRVLQIVGVLFLLALLAAGLFFYRIREALKALGGMPSMPDEIKVARVVSGSDQFSKAGFYSEPDLGLISSVSRRTDGSLLLVGQLGAASLNRDGTFNGSLHFERCASGVVPVQAGAGAFLCRGAWSDGAKLYDSEGKTLWSYGGGPAGVDDAAAGELGTDEAQKVVVGLNGGGGVKLLDAAGKELWTQDDANVWHVEIVAGDEGSGDGGSGNVILHSNARGQLTARDASGKVIARYTPALYLASFSLSSWGNAPEINKLVAADESFIYVLTTHGETLARLPAPGNAGISDPRATPVHFSTEAPYFAALLRHSIWTRSLLYIYDAQNQLVYDEVLDHDCDALGAIPTADHSEDLLLGCDGLVWKYSLRR